MSITRSKSHVREQAGRRRVCVCVCVSSVACTYGISTPSGFSGSMEAFKWPFATRTCVFVWARKWKQTLNSSEGGLAAGFVSTRGPT